MSVYDGLAVPKIIYQSSSQFNENIKVIDTGRSTKLVVHNTTQSVNADSPAANSMFWGRTVRLLQEVAPELETLLIFGLGGGTMQHLISRAYPGIAMVTVDIDPVIVDIAYKFFNVGDIKNHNVIVDDACRVIIEPHTFNLQYSSFDAVIVDIFIGDEYPDLGKSGNFLTHLCKMVVPGGLVVINRIYLEDHQEDVHMFIDNVEMYLKDVRTIIVPGKTNSDNMLIYGRAK